MGGKKMSTDKNQKNNKDKKNSFLSLLFTKLFGGKEKLSILEEEQMQSPFRTIIKNFMDNKISMSGVIVFLLIFAFVIIGPIFLPQDLSFTESTQRNVGVGLDLMKYPEELKGNVQDIAIGSTYTIGLSKDNKLYIWGKTKMNTVDDIKNIPEGMGNIVKVAAGFDHAIALNEDGKLFGWGSNRQMQAEPVGYVTTLKNISELYAGYQLSIVLTEDGSTYHFGNVMLNDYNEFHKYQGKLKQLAMTNEAVVGLTKDGEVVYLGNQSNSYSRIPENMGNVIDIAASTSTMAALNDKGEVFVWGNISQKGEGNVPVSDGKIIDIEAGRYHYTALTEDGKVLAWGYDNYGQATVPSRLQNTNIKELYTGYYQNYAVAEDGSIHTWGLKGYILGSDDMGRDILNRLVNGGKMSMTVGAVAVIISTIIGVIIGSLSGYFGGKLDIILQRLTEMVASLPFLPFVMILSSLIGNKMEPNQKVWMIMVILGLLSWPGLARLIRAQVLSVREQEYVVAARAVGVKKLGIVFRHILPNIISVILVSATLDFATCMLTEATLSYLGFGVPAPQPTWGNMLYGANSSIVIKNYWWRWVYASILLGICVISINVVGDGLRDAVDPKSQER